MTNYSDTELRGRIHPDRLFAFDIETEPDPHAVQKYTDDYPPFDPADVKHGNTKDPAKISEKVELAAKAHRDGEKAYWSNAHEKGSLSPLTGRVLAIGIRGNDFEECHYAKDGFSESDILLWFWDKYEELCLNTTHHGRKIYFCGWNSDSFDIPFLIKRSWARNINIPDKVIDVCLSSRHVWSTYLVDLMLVFNAGSDWQKRRFKLEKAGDFLGLGKKLDTQHQLFHELFNSGHDDDLILAKRYLQRDIELTYEIGRVLLTEAMQ
jgi:hypothetical protein